jgi:hypothetical protein
MTEKFTRKLWNIKEEEQLHHEIKNDNTIQEIAKKHERSNNAIVMHLCEMAKRIIDNDKKSIDYVQKIFKLISVNEIENFIIKENEKKKEKEAKKVTKNKTNDKKQNENKIFELEEKINKLYEIVNELKINLINKTPNAQNLTNICKEINKMRIFTYNNFESLILLITGRKKTELLFKTDYNKWKNKIDYDRTFADFYLKLDNNNKQKFIKWYSDNSGISIDDVENNINYCVKINNILDNGDELWSKMLDFNHNELNELPIREIHIYEERLASNKVSDNNKEKIYNLLKF